MNQSERPYVFLVTGMSLDGKISNYKRTCSPISSDDNRDMLYDGRIRADAVMVGGRTLLLDDSALDVKTEERQNKRVQLGKTKQPMKVAVVSDASDLKLDSDFLTRGNGDKIIFTTERTSKEKIRELEKVCKIFVIGNEKVDLKQALAKLKKFGVKELMVEGGGELIYSLFKYDLVDEINLKIGDIILGGRNASTLCDGDGFLADTAKRVELIDLKRMGSVLVLKYKVIRE
ncbi:MAG: dihydrofolate reductase family protein [Patescibacteria group bacterium]